MSNQRPRYNWNDIVYFLEVARQKSLVRAAEKLRVDHTTVSRRVRELERSLNTSLFSRGKSGFNLTETGQRLLEFADGLGGKPLHCAFYGGEFLMAIPRDGNLFEIGRLTRSLDHAEADIRRLANEFTIPQRLIDNLHGDRVAVLGEG